MLKEEVRKNTHTHTYLHVHTHSSESASSLLLRLAEVVAEVEVAGRFGDERRAVRDGHVLQVQEAELDFHGEEDLQLAVHGLAAHLPSQEDVQPVRPQAELAETKPGYVPARGRFFFFRFLKTHVSSGGSDEIQAVLFHIIGDAEGQVQNLLRTNTGRRQPAAGGRLRRRAPPLPAAPRPPCSVCLCSLSCGGSLSPSASL